MPLAVTFPHIEKLEGASARLQRLPRIRMAQIVMDYLAYGWSPDEMCRQHPHLRPAESHAAMTYYFVRQPGLRRTDFNFAGTWSKRTRDVSPGKIEICTSEPSACDAATNSGGLRP